jgi:RNA-directed DNA polymerase
VAWYQRQARCYAYALKLDLARYFPSIDHAILKTGYRTAIADPMMLIMLDRIVDSAGGSAAWLGWLWPDEDLVDTAERRCGLPIGNLTSQVLSNWMLDPIDWALARRPGVGAMLRYVDDIVVLGDRKADLWAAVEWLDEALARLRLKRHPFKLQLIPTRLRMDLLGYQAGRRKRWLRNNTAYAARRRLHEVADDYREGRLLLADVRSHVNAWIGHARFAHSQGLRCAILDPLVFQRGSDET